SQRRSRRIIPRTAVFASISRSSEMLTAWVLLRFLWSGFLVLPARRCHVTSISFWSTRRRSSTTRFGRHLFPRVLLRFSLHHRSWLKWLQSWPMQVLGIFPFCYRNWEPWHLLRPSWPACFPECSYRSKVLPFRAQRNRLRA